MLIHENPFHRETDFLYIPQSPKITDKVGMPCILQMAIIGLLKVSCEGRRAATTTTAARTGHTRSAGAAAGTDRTGKIGSASTPSGPTLPAA